MEDSLDKIVENKNNLENICDNCLKEINTCNKKVEKQEYKIDDNNLSIFEVSFKLLYIHTKTKKTGWNSKINNLFGK